MYEYEIEDTSLYRHMTIFGVADTDANYDAIEDFASSFGDFVSVEFANGNAHVRLIRTN